MDRHRNYQKELDKLIDKIQKAGIRPRLLLHACCAPCSSYVLEYLSQYFDIIIFYYNPNIDSKEEYDKRAEELRRLIGDMGLSSVELIIGEYEPEVFYQTVKGHEKDPERGERCRLCYELRLRRTAELAKSLSSEGRGIDYFCTTLSISPLKDAEALNDIGEELADELALRDGSCGEGPLGDSDFEQRSLVYLPSDFKKREGYKRSIELSREYGLYRQDYCGCVYSKRGCFEEASLQKDMQAEDVQAEERPY